MKCDNCGKNSKEHLSLCIGDIVLNFCSNTCLENHIKSKVKYKSEKDLLSLSLDINGERFLVDYLISNDRNIEIINLQNRNGRLMERNHRGMYIDSIRHIVLNDEILAKEIRCRIN